MLKLKIKMFKIFKNYKLLLVGLLLCFGFIFFILAISVDVQAEPGDKDDLYGLNTTAGESDLPMNDKDTIPITIGKIIGAGLAFIGIIFFLLVIYGGFTWMLARGNEQEVTKAKDLIESAAIGLVIVLAAYAITAFIGNALDL